jgi:hypothetical protein
MKSGRGGGTAIEHQVVKLELCIVQQVERGVGDTLVVRGAVNEEVVLTKVEPQQGAASPIKLCEV